MEVQNRNYKELIDKIDYNNYLLGVNSNLKRKQPRKIQVLRTQMRDKTPVYTRVRNFLNSYNNDNYIYENQNFINNRINNKYIISSNKSTEKLSLIVFSLLIAAIPAASP